MSETGCAPPGGAWGPDSDVRRDVLAVLDADGISPVFQPIWNLRAGRIAAFEALSRVRVGEFGDVGAFFAAASLAGLERETAELSGRKAIRGASGLPPPLSLFVNFSPDVVADPRFPEELAEAVEGSGGIGLDRVVVEITERPGREDVSQLSRRVRTLKKLGFGVALDDVGAGASGLDRIMALEPDWLKLDRSLVRGVHEHRTRRHLVRSLAHFADLGGIGLVAEGVEEDTELRALMDIGVRHAQGFLLGHPDECWRNSMRAQSSRLAA
ncbi:MAG: EAL domain-containing protein [Phycisphaeraceae bacterium]|nr:EAL domain-containing protein [Phycisphaeraceae bacterium]